jgi:hypothetical protein
MFFEERGTLTLAIDRVNGVCNSFPHDGVWHAEVLLFPYTSEFFTQLAEI